MYRWWTRNFDDSEEVEAMNKIVSIEEAVSKIKENDVLLVGGFLGVGSPHHCIDELIKQKTAGLTLVCNDSGFPEIGVGKLIMTKQFSKVIASHIGTNKETGRQMMEEETIVELVPQGTLVEQIRAGGYGLGGVLTKTGLGTKVEEGKQTVVVDGETYLLEKPIRGNVALIYANKVDKFGNMQFHGAARNFNTIMASAADLVIVEADEIVEVGDLDPDFVHCPGIFVDFIVNGGAIRG